ncbi:putative mitochondrial mitochondrial RNA binding complex 1 subunit [Leptomonas pyrrhocoris]|uniref:Putative mitochondrial mitochondrial RNA binding complex 1 subunit n=1 Tax=Leptomonas pyrrhocoris TaxID=157538 RepID=A0A0M9G952_LEPPY|nr:putative mitochondrial mitochondrial RNA binding complex 1 subunit [Leptomonas pyrrhocoris]KPA85277.1 putative mitochondrial mitochondrial RNA binding complex 1 subunit [Leptomonas pyrrhocoris]|eukprot:XP_015663716.1 putative mitochondrial mitochondrial RNA binding complex 1 subunit [Leptomonas pyrrhocoris]
MFRKIATPALTGVSSAYTRAVPSVFITESNGTATNSVRAAVSVSFLSNNRSSRGMCSLCTSQRCYIHTSRLARDDAAQQAPPSSDNATAAPAAPAPGAASATNESALDVAMRVNKLKKTHQTGGAGSNKQEVEQEAWQALNSLTEDQINNAEGKAVSLLLNSWAYFAKFWAKGKDGPL